MREPLGDTCRKTFCEQLANFVHLDNQTCTGPSIETPDFLPSSAFREISARLGSELREFIEILDDAKPLEQFERGHFEVLSPALTSSSAVLISEVVGCSNPPTASFGYAKSLLRPARAGGMVEPGRAGRNANETLNLATTIGSSYGLSYLTVRAPNGARHPSRVPQSRRKSHRNRRETAFSRWSPASRTCASNRSDLRRPSGRRQDPFVFTLTDWCAVFDKDYIEVLRAESFKLRNNFRFISRIS